MSNGAVLRNVWRAAVATALALTVAHAGAQPPRETGGVLLEIKRFVVEGDGGARRQLVAQDEDAGVSRQGRLGGAVAAGVVDDDHLAARRRGSEEGVQAAERELPRVVRRDDDGERRPGGGIHVAVHYLWDRLCGKKKSPLRGRGEFSQPGEEPTFRALRVTRREQGAYPSA